MDITFEHPFARSRGGSDKLRRLVLSGLVVAAAGALAIHGGMGALAATSGDAGRFSRGTVYLTTSDTGTMFSLPALVPGQTVTRFAAVTSQGSLPSSVRLFAQISGTGLARFLTLTVTRGTGGRDTFVPDAVDHRATGPGIVYSGPLSGFPRSWDEGIDAGGWRRGQTQTYRFEITLSELPRAQGLTAGADFRWEARNI